MVICAPIVTLKNCNAQKFSTQQKLYVNNSFTMVAASKLPAYRPAGQQSGQRRPNESFEQQIQRITKAKNGFANDETVASKWRLQFRRLHLRVVDLLRQLHRLRRQALRWPQLRRQVHLVDTCQHRKQRSSCARLFRGCPPLRRLLLHTRRRLLPRMQHYKVDVEARSPKRMCVLSRLHRRPGLPVLPML